MKRFLVFMAVLALATAGLAEEKKQSDAKLKLENAQLKLKLAFVDLQKQQSEFQVKFQEFNQACEAAVKELKLAEGTKCNPDTLEFVAPKVEEKK